MELDIQRVLLGAILIDDRLAPYALPDLSVEHFRPELQDTFAAVQGFWEATGKLDVLQIISRYPMQKETVLACVQLCENECVRLTSDHVEEWTRAILENAAKDRFQKLAMQAVDASVSYSDLPDLYQKMGEAEVHPHGPFQAGRKPAPCPRKLFHHRWTPQRGQDGAQPAACCRNGEARDPGVLFQSGDRPGDTASQIDRKPALCAALGGKKQNAVHE